MSPEKAAAIVLKVVEFSETSSVVTLFTREFGKIHALAKGARRPKGLFESALDLLAHCSIVFLRKSSGTLDLLTEAKLLRRFRPSGHDLTCLYAGYYVAELLTDLTDDYDPHPLLFDLADEMLLGLSRGAGVSRAVLRFELAALSVLGHLPSLHTCTQCVQSGAGERSRVIWTISRRSFVWELSSGKTTGGFDQRRGFGGDVPTIRFAVRRVGKARTGSPNPRRTARADW